MSIVRTDGEVPPFEERQPAPRGQLLSEEAAMHSIAAVERHARTTNELVQGLHDWLQRANEPADYQIHTGDAVTPKRTLNTKGHKPSIGVINPSPLTVYVGIGGAPATHVGRAFPVPANSGVILPVSVEDPEIGFDPADVAGLAGATGVYYVLLFETVQLFHLWRF